MLRGEIREPEVVIAMFLSLIIATTIHEFMHAWTAWRLGDDTAARLGRITLNPAMHFDPIGFLLMGLLALGIGFIGWGKPVPVNPNAFGGDVRRRHIGMGIVAFAGPLSNVAQAAVVGIPLRIADQSGADLGQLGFYMSWFVYVNILLAAFNMIPFPPLDGSRILVALLPNFWYPILAPLERYGIAILFVVLFFGNLFGPLISGITNPVFTLLLDAIVGDAINLAPPI
jgi:Zn-dependent protease